MKLKLSPKRFLRPPSRLKFWVGVVGVVAGVTCDLSDSQESKLPFPNLGSIHWGLGLGLWTWTQGCQIEF